MAVLVGDLIARSTPERPSAPALKHKNLDLSYGELNQRVLGAAHGFVRLGLGRSERVAVYLEKRHEAVIAMFGAATAGLTFVPVSPVLRPHQVAHILRDCNVRVLVTSRARLDVIWDTIESCADLRHVVLVDGEVPSKPVGTARVLNWDAAVHGSEADAPRLHRVIENDMAAIFYTSGSTGLPKGVVLSHRNLVSGAESVATYLENTAEDRILSLLPLNFDAGFSQLTTAFLVGASVVLLDFVFARDAIQLAANEEITGIAGVPPLWNQLAEIEWPQEAARPIRYFTNTGDRMPRRTLDLLRRKLPNAKPYLMYGLTESFRSTYLHPSEIDRRPDSIGKAVPNAEILVVRDDGTLAGPGEAGELVHRGPFVSLGYWNDPDRTAERFKPAPARPGELVMPEMAVWSGDTVRLDEDGFLYFVGRRDGMIKTSGYRVSPTEIENVIYASGFVKEAVAVGVPHPSTGQSIVVIATPPSGKDLALDAVIDCCRRRLPAYMVPQKVIERAEIPRNANGKIDRKQLADELSNLFAAGSMSPRDERELSPPKRQKGAVEA
jgi:acyl-CoA ligase (AMP-forming) (exosortase A-associated)